MPRPGYEHVVVGNRLPGCFIGPAYLHSRSATSARLSVRCRCERFFVVDIWHTFWAQGCEIPTRCPACRQKGDAR